jgi:hypothetical protein
MEVVFFFKKWPEILAYLKIIFNFVIQSTFYMQKEKDYIKDIAAIRTMMERSSKFLSLSGWAGILAGIYAIVGAYISYVFFKFNPVEIVYTTTVASFAELLNVIVIATVVLLLSIGTAIFLSFKRATKRAESLWNATSRRMLINMSVPLASGGVLILVFISLGLIGLIAPLSLLFYGLALFSAGNYTFSEVRFLGIILILLGLLGSCFIEYGLLLWVVGFGLMHIVYGIYIHIKHQR